MNTSARNQFDGQVSAVKTNESVAKLGLKKGVEACALFMASSMIIGVKA
ncbi:hypothetical protein [Sulfuricella sp.]|nr:hypothetical protein [Sulfuricella sp.]HUX64895.1 hypothetical protein [Sulfuricella sp.]